MKNFSCFNVFKNNDITFSFELFPPKTQKGEEKLYETAEALSKFKPSFISVTYGAGGSTKEKTCNIAKKLYKKNDIEIAAHLTCVAASKNEVLETAQEYKNIGIKHIVALRGDMPEGKNFIPHPNGFKHSVELVSALKELGNFEISVAAFPETHPEAKNSDSDIKFLKEKIDAGANRAITQYFFDPEVFLNFLEKTQKVGINKPIIPGIILSPNITQLKKFSKICQATIPRWINELYTDYQKDSSLEGQESLATMIALEQCRILYKNGIKNFHFYTLNRYDLVSNICRIFTTNK